MNSILAVGGHDSTKENYETFDNYSQDILEMKCSKDIFQPEYVNGKWTTKAVLDQGRAGQVVMWIPASATPF